MIDPAVASDALKWQARSLGLDACGCASVGDAGTDKHLSQWIEAGMHADMRWFERTREARENPASRLPDAKTVVVVAQGYWDGSGSISAPGSVARYARLTDYHAILGEKVRALAEWLDSLRPDAHSFWSVDSGAIMEKRWAVRAGIGWQGKNSLIVREGLGSWLFLGAIVTSLEIRPDTPAVNACAGCDACIRACPTGALAEPGVLDARRCLSYHTIENKGETPDDVARANPGCIAGCDLCQEACPWNQPERLTPVNSPFTPLPTALLSPRMVAATDDLALTRMLTGSPLQRLGIGRLRRNAIMPASGK
jgi:epoxyqueuosine reductase